MKVWCTNQIPKYQMYDIGNYTYGQPVIYRFKMVEKAARANLKIGKFCSIADGTRILLGGEHRLDWISTYPFHVMFPGWRNLEVERCFKAFKKKGDITIGNDVWIGMNVTILSGVTIGSGACIGADSLVSKNIGPYEIWAGNPAKLIKKRFSDEVIQFLLKVAWWDWPIEKVQEHANILYSGDIEALRRVVG